jgi:hypothetical protein
MDVSMLEIQVSSSEFHIPNVNLLIVPRSSAVDRRSRDLKTGAHFCGKQKHEDLNEFHEPWRSCFQSAQSNGVSRERRGNSHETGEAGCEVTRGRVERKFSGCRGLKIREKEACQRLFTS